MQRGFSPGFRRRRGHRPSCCRSTGLKSYARRKGGARQLLRCLRLSCGYPPRKRRGTGCLPVLPAIRSDSYEQLQTEPQLDYARKIPLQPSHSKGGLSHIIEASGGPADRFRPGCRRSALTDCLLPMPAAPTPRRPLVHPGAPAVEHGQDGHPTLEDYQSFGGVGLGSRPPSRPPSTSRRADRRRFRPTG
jgi:hypothetical protein